MPIRISCVGDSITRGLLSADYLAVLAARHPPGALALSRFAANGDFAFNVAQRLDEVIATPADVVTVLVGTNDARASLPGYPLERWMARKGLPVHPTAAWYRQQLHTVVGRLQRETDAVVGVLSLPVLGQDPLGPAGQASAAYSAIAADVAADAGARLVRLHDRQLDALERASVAPVPFEEPSTARIVGDLLQRRVLRRSLDDLADRRGLLLAVDHIHQCHRGAALIAAAIDEELVRPLVADGRSA